MQKCHLTLKIINISSQAPVQCISFAWFQKISVPTQKVVIEDFKGGGESQKPKFLGKVHALYEAKLGIPEREGGLKPKKPSLEKVWKFSGTTH